MPLVRFLGFPTGSSVSLVASQDTETADITVAPWNVARSTETLALALSRTRPEFRRAPEAIWAEAVTAGFSGLTRLIEVPSPSGSATWSNGPGSHAALDVATRSGPALFHLASIEAGADPRGVVFEAGGTGDGLAAAFDAEGDLVIGAGDGTATESGPGAVFLRVPRNWFVNRTTDLWLAFDPASQRMRAHVVDSATGELRAVLTKPGTSVALSGTGNAAAIAALFSNSEQGAWFDVNDLSTLAANPDGTGAVSVGDRVGHVADKSGNGNHLTASGDARPILRQDAGGKYYLEFDGVDDFMLTANRVAWFGASTGGTVGYAGLATGENVHIMDARESSPNEAVWGLIVDQAGTTEPRFYPYDTGRNFPFGVEFSGETVADLTPHIGVGIATTTSAELWTNGVSDGPSTVGSPVTYSNTAYLSPVGRADGIVGAGHFYGGIVVNRAVTEAERLAIQGWLASLYDTESIGISQWADAGGVGVGQANGQVRAGVATGALTDCTVGDVSIWSGQLPADFADDLPHLYDPEFHEIFYEWDCVRPSDGTRLTYTAPQNVLPGFEDAGKQRGRFACFVMPEPGDWQITCTARQVKSVDPLTFVEVSASETVTVGADLFGPTEGDPLWTADNTICMAADGDFTGAPTGHHIAYEPAGSGNAYRTALASAFANAPDLGDGTKAVRVLLKRGEGQDTPISGEWFNIDELVGRFGERFPHVVLGAWGEGPNPITDGSLAYGNGQAPNNSETFIAANIDIKGSLNHITRDYEENTSIRGYFPKPKPGSYHLFTGFAMSDFWGIGIYWLPTAGGAEYEANPYIAVVHDCAFDNVMDYAWFGSYGPGRGCKTAFIGNRALHPAEAPTYLQGEGPGQAGRKNHGPLRSGGSGDFVVDGNDFFTRHGWTGGIGWPDGTPQVAAQPHVRIGGNGRVVFTRNTGEGDGSMGSFNSLGQFSTSVQNVLIDGNYKLFGANPVSFCSKEGGSVTVRNNMAVYHYVNGGRPFSSVFSSFRMNARLAYTVEQLAWEPVADYGNTMVVLGGNNGVVIDDSVSIADEFEIYTVSNNVIYAPGVAGQPGHVDLAPFDATEMFEARYLGRWEGGYDTALVTSLATPDGTASLYAPLSGSAVDGGATAGYVPLFDILGAPRWPLATLGAVQVPPS
ncbi:hypothetical protein DLJ49_10545 [Rhodovulum sp. 12E13]|uniref:hypothetical protein n=1 Tax=Rhodovulum sp. 12E13 TaxID=2203891 RepID=UPI000E127853|nr:hypothetical protein [Rhodovulum sp. 12E13]RDC72344.1 hypothetical protein DLJ49_10545 [Rhodovulum sp. 12E13]